MVTTPKNPQKGQRTAEKTQPQKNSQQQYRQEDPRREQDRPRAQ